MFKLRKYAKEYECLPKFYGVAWIDYVKNQEICYPIPLNFLAGWLYLLIGVLKMGHSSFIYGFDKRIHDKKRKREKESKRGNMYSQIM